MIKIFIIIIFSIIIYFKYLHYSKENFQIKVIRNLNNKLDKIINKDKPKKFIQIKDSEYNDTSKKFLYNNKIVITGGTSGIGYEVAKMVNKYKPFLVICGKKKHKVIKIVSELKKYNDNVYGVWIDLSVEKGGQKMFNAIREHINTIDILINNAIINKGSRFLLSKNESDWENEISVNINSNIGLTQKIASHMKVYKIKGRIINISSQSSKASDTNLNSGSEILMKNMIEKYSNLLADELYPYKIAVTTIRIDDNYNTSKNTLLNFNLEGKFYKKYFGKMFDVNMDKFTPLFLYTIKAPFHEISGKIISSDSFKSDIELSKIIPSHQIKLNNTYKKFKFNKFNKSNNKTYLVKQNPFKMSPNINKIINDKLIKNINTEARYKPILDSVIAKNLNIKKNNIVFFKTEYDCIKKLTDIFVPKRQNIIVVNPIWSILKLVALENKIEIKFSVLKELNNKLIPDFNLILKYINTKTKMIYLSSPNIISGQSITKSDFEAFIKEVPENIIILLDQRYLEFSDNINTMNGKNYLKHKNIIVLRTFNNYYSIENLELTYILTHKHLAKFIKDNTIINQIDYFNEKIALEIYKDSYYNSIKKKMMKNKKDFIKHLKNNKITFFPSETYFLLIKAGKYKSKIEAELEKRNIILYKSNDHYNNYWTLPLSTKNVNDTIIDVLVYSNM